MEQARKGTSRDARPINQDKKNAAYESDSEPVPLG